MLAAQHEPLRCGGTSGGLSASPWPASCVCCREPYDKVVGGDQRTHNKGQRVAALDLQLQINMTHFANETHEYLQAW